MDTLKIEIYGDIGYRYYDWVNDQYVGVDFASVESQIKDFEGDSIKVYINSFGGSVLEGLAIYNLLVGHKAKVTTHVVGYAISMGSVIFMAGDEREMPSNGWLMIHEASMYTQGDSSSLKKDANLLDAMSDQIASIYAKKSTKYSKKEFRDFMREEEWITGKDAKSKFGLVTKVTAGVSIAAKFKKEDFKNMPQGLIEIINSEKKDNNNRMEYKEKFESLQNKVAQFFGVKADGVETLDLNAAFNGLAENSVKTELDTRMKSFNDIAAKFGEEGEYTVAINAAKELSEKLTAQDTIIASLKETVATQNTTIETQTADIQASKDSIDTLVAEKLEAIKATFEGDIATQVAEAIDKGHHNAGGSVVDVAQANLSNGIRDVKLAEPTS